MSIFSYRELLQAERNREIKKLVEKKELEEHLKYHEAIEKLFLVQIEYQKELHERIMELSKPDVPAQPAKQTEQSKVRTVEEGEFGDGTY